MAKISEQINLCKNKIINLIKAGIDEPFAILSSLLSIYTAENEHKTFVRHLQNFLKDKKFINVDPTFFQQIECYLTKGFRRDHFYALLLAYFHYYKDAFQVYYRPSKTEFPFVTKFILRPLEVYAATDDSKRLVNVLQTEYLYGQRYSIQIILEQMRDKAALTIDDVVLLQAIIKSIGQDDTNDKIIIGLLADIHLPASLLASTYQALLRVKISFGNTDALYALILQIDQQQANLIDAFSLITANLAVHNAGVRYIKERLLPSANEVELAALNERILSHVSHSNFYWFSRDNALTQLLLSDAWPERLRQQNFAELVPRLTENMSMLAQAGLIRAFANTAPPLHLLDQLIQHLTNIKMLYYANRDEAFGVLGTLKIPDAYKQSIYTHLRKITRGNNFFGVSVQYLLSYKAMLTPLQLRTITDDILQHNGWTLSIAITVVGLCVSPENRQWLIDKIITESADLSVAKMDQTCLMLAQLDVNDQQRPRVLTFLYNCMRSEHAGIAGHACLAFNNPSLITEENRGDIVSALRLCIATQEDSVKLSAYEALASIDKMSSKSIIKCHELCEAIQSFNHLTHPRIRFLFEMMSRIDIPEALYTTVIDAVLLHAAYIDIPVFITLLTKQPLPQAYHAQIMKKCINTIGHEINISNPDDIKRANLKLVPLYEYMQTLRLTGSEAMECISNIIDRYAYHLDFKLLFSSIALPQDKVEEICEQLLKRFKQGYIQSTPRYVCFETLFKRLDVVQQTKLLMKVEAQADDFGLTAFTQHLRRQYVNCAAMTSLIDQHCEPKLPSEVWENITCCNLR